MDENNREPLLERWDRLRRHLDEARADRTPLLQFSLTSFLITTTAIGATIGCIVRLGSDGGTVLGLVVALVLYFVVSVAGLVLYVWLSDRDVWHRHRAGVSRPRRRTSTSNAAGGTRAVADRVQNDQVDLPEERTEELEQR